MTVKIDILIEPEHGGDSGLRGAKAPRLVGPVVGPVGLEPTLSGS
jgi:hypothetical protein